MLGLYFGVGASNIIDLDLSVFFVLNGSIIRKFATVVMLV